MAHQHAHDHHHPATITADVAGSRVFIIGILLNVLFVIGEVVAGLLTHSVALLTDAGHNISDVASLLLSLLALYLARKKPTAAFTYGYKKTTILAALSNAVLLLVAVGILGYESVVRLYHPQPVAGAVVSWVAGLGILVNGLTAWLFAKGRAKDLNVRSAYLHMLADALVSVGVVVAGIVMSFTHWYWLDPVIGLVIMLVIVFSTWSLLRDSVRLAVDAVPEGLDVPAITSRMKSVPGVTDVHHVHIWPLSTTENALTAHVVLLEALSPAEQSQRIRELKHLLRHEQISHSTIELETASSGCPEQHCTLSAH